MPSRKSGPRRSAIHRAASPRTSSPFGRLSPAVCLWFLVAACPSGGSHESAAAPSPTKAPALFTGRLSGIIEGPSLAGPDCSAPTQEAGPAPLAGVLIRGPAGRTPPSPPGPVPWPPPSCGAALLAQAGRELPLHFDGTAHVLRVDGVALPGQPPPVRLESLAVPPGLGALLWPVPPSGLHGLSEDGVPGRLLVATSGRPVLAITDAGGAFVLEGLPSAPLPLRLWHPILGEVAVEVPLDPQGDTTWRYRWPGS